MSYCQPHNLKNREAGKSYIFTKKNIDCKSLDIKLTANVFKNFPNDRMFN